MKKTLVLSVLLITTFASGIAQDKPKAGDLVYGTVFDGNESLSGIIVTEINRNNRIMAQTTTNENGNFSFRIVNPDDKIHITVSKNSNYSSAYLPITDIYYEVNMETLGSGTDQNIKNEFAGLDIVFGPDEPSFPQDLYTINSTMLKMYKQMELKSIPGNGIYIPFTDNTWYYTIEDLFENWYPRFGPILHY